MPRGGAARVVGISQQTGLAGWPPGPPWLLLCMPERRLLLGNDRRHRPVGWRPAAARHLGTAGMDRGTREGRGMRCRGRAGAGVAAAVVALVVAGCGTKQASSAGPTPGPSRTAVASGSAISTTDTAAERERGRSPDKASSHASAKARQAAAERRAKKDIEKRQRQRAQVRKSAAARKAASERKAKQRARQKQQGQLSPVLRVVDGDTVHVAYHGRDVSVRVIGIDTPETVSPSVPDECGGKAASAVAHRLLDGRNVRLVFDPSQGRLDKYGRILAYLERPGLGDYGKTMIRKGLAAEYTYDTAYRRQASYQAAEAVARAVGRQTWGRCGGFDTPLPKPTPTHTTHAPAPARAPASPAGNCAPGYSPCVPPYPPDAKCADVNGPITVTGDDPHRLDRDGDGIACE